MSTEQVVMEKLDRIEKEIHEIKEHMVDIDSIMTEDDYEALLAYRKEKASGKLISHGQLKKELGL
ncbi:MAG TPA: hypothetical protein VJA47_06100 [archaeon]|nr:hypothetical protein [archaeon]